MTNHRTVVEQVAFDMYRRELLKVLSECPDEIREELMQSLYLVYCRYCWQPFKSREICHCMNDE